MTRKDIVKLSVAGLLFVGAGLLYVILNFGGPDIPGSLDAKTPWYCTQCHEGFELTGEEGLTQIAERVTEESSNASAPGNKPKARRSRDIGKIRVAKCPKCGTFSGVTARRCSDCGTVFRAATGDGDTAVCPKCRWDPLTGKTATPQRAREGTDS